MMSTLKFSPHKSGVTSSTDFFYSEGPYREWPFTVVLRPSSEIRLNVPFCLPVGLNLSPFGNVRFNVFMRKSCS